MLLGQARGKVGDIVFSRNNGQQVIKARSEQVKNPQTTAQVMQRILLNTVSQAYSKMLAICDHSFEGVKTGQDTMSAFMKRNLNQLRSRVVNLKNQTGSLAGFYAVTPIGSKALALNPYIMATGTLPAVAITAIEGSDAASSVAKIEVPGVTGDLTYEALIAGYGLRRGDQLTFITLNYDAAQGITFNFARVILDPTNADGTPALITSNFIGEGAILNASDRNEGNFARLSAAGGVVSFSIAGGVVCGAAVIVSRQADSGDWMRSNAVLKIPASVAEFDQFALLDAIDLFYSGGIDFESNYYLNNAERSTQSGTAEPINVMNISELKADGSPILGTNSTVDKTTADTVVVTGTVDSFSAADNCKVVFSTSPLTVDSLYAQEAGHVVVGITQSPFTGNAKFKAGSYTAYFVAGGYVRKQCGKVEVTAAPSDGGGGEG